MFCQVYMLSCFLRDVFDSLTLRSIFTAILLRQRKSILSERQLSTSYMQTVEWLKIQELLTWDGLSKWQLSARFSRVTNTSKSILRIRRSMASDPVGDCCKICLAIVLRLFTIKIKQTLFESILITTLSTS